MKKLTIFTLISLFSNILSMEVDSNIDQDNIESSIFYLQSEMALPILPELKSYVNQIKSANDIFEFYKFFDQEKNAELSNMRLNGKLFNIIIADIYLKRINAKFEELKAKAIADCQNKSKEDLNKELKDILNLEKPFEEEKLKEFFKLITAGADVNHQNENGDTALILAIRKGHTEVVKLLLDINADVNHQNIYGETALIIASSRKACFEIVKLLLDKNVDVNFKNKTGSRALMIAVFHGHIEITKLLLDKNADVNLEGGHSMTALKIAELKGNAEIINLLNNKKNS